MPGKIIGKFQSNEIAVTVSRCVVRGLVRYYVLASNKNMVLDWWFGSLEVALEKKREIVEQFHPGLEEALCPKKTSTTSASPSCLRA